MNEIRPPRRAIAAYGNESCTNEWWTGAGYETSSFVHRSISRPASGVEDLHPGARQLILEATSQWCREPKKLDCEMNWILGLRCLS